MARKTAVKNIRFTPDELTDIQARADAALMSFSEYMIRAAQGRLDSTEDRLRQAINDLDSRLSRLEQNLIEQPAW